MSGGDKNIIYTTAERPLIYEDHNKEIKDALDRIRKTLDEILDKLKEFSQ